MKKKELKKKLSINKEKISNLNLDKIRGGYIKDTDWGKYTDYTCNGCDIPPPGNPCDSAGDCETFGSPCTDYCYTQDHQCHH